MRGIDKYAVVHNDLVLIDVKKELRKLHIRASELKMLRFITNEILTNCSYADRNQEKQESYFDLAQVPQQQRDIIRKAWDFKKVMGELLLCDLNKFLDNYNVNIDKINAYLEQSRDVK